MGGAHVAPILPPWQKQATLPQQQILHALPGTIGQHFGTAMLHPAPIGPPQQQQQNSYAVPGTSGQLFHTQQQDQNSGYTIPGTNGQLFHTQQQDQNSGYTIPGTNGQLFHTQQQDQNSGYTIPGTNGQLFHTQQQDQNSGYTIPGTNGQLFHTQQQDQHRGYYIPGASGQHLGAAVQNPAPIGPAQQQRSVAQHMQAAGIRQPPALPGAQNPLPQPPQQHTPVAYHNPAGPSNQQYTNLGVNYMQNQARPWRQTHGAHAIRNEPYYAGAPRERPPAAAGRMQADNPTMQQQLSQPIGPPPSLTNPVSQNNPLAVVYPAAHPFIDPTQNAGPADIAGIGQLPGQIGHVAAAGQLPAQQPVQQIPDLVDLASAFDVDDLFGNIHSPSGSF